MTALHSALALPVFLLGTALAQSHVTNAQQSVSIEKALAPKKISKAVSVQTVADQTPFVLQRKDRIARVLITLDRVAALTVQMKPETADRVEPVIVDLAEQAINLANESSLRTSTTDTALTKLETTVNELVRTMNRYVEPEASL